MKKTFFVACVWMVGAAFAGEAHWTGAEDGYWTNANNWAEGVVPGRVLALDAGGNLVTNGVKGDVAYFGDDLAGNAVTTINFDGVYSISNLLTTGRNQQYTYGASSAQYVPIESCGIFSAGETADTRVAVVACGLKVGVECFTTGYGSDYVVIRNNSSEEFSQGDWGWHTAIPGGTTGTYGKEMGIHWEGTGDIRVVGTAKKWSNPQAQMKMTTGRLIFDADFGCRAFIVPNNGNTTTLRQIVITANGKLRHAAGYYNFLSAQAPLRISGEGPIVFSAGYRAASKEWKCSANTFYHPTEIACPVQFTWGTTPTDDNGGTSFTPYIWFQNGSSTLTFNVPDGDNQMQGLIWIGSGGNNQVAEFPTLGLRGTYASMGDCDFLIGRGATIRYTGSGETTDRTITITNQTTKGAILEQAGTGPLVVDSQVLLAANASDATLTLKNDTSSRATFRAAIEVALNLSKTGSGLWELGGANTYSGTTAVEEGTLRVLRTGSVASSSAITVAAGAVLEFEGDASEATSYSAPAITPTDAGAGLVLGENVTLTLASLPSSSSGTMDITVPAGSTIVVTGASAGSAPTWLTINGGPAEITSEGTLRQTVLVDGTEIAVYGGRIPDASGSNVGITTVGDSADGPIRLATDTSATVDALTQRTDTSATVDLDAGQTLTTAMLATDSGAAGITVGSATEQGTLAAASGTFTLWPGDEESTIEVKSAFDGSAASSVIKLGPGTARFSAPLDYSGTLDIRCGTLALSNSTSLAASLAGSGTFVKEGAEDWTLTQSQTSFNGRFVVAGGTVKPGAADASELFGDISADLVITNGATLYAHASSSGSGSATFGTRTVHCSGDGADGNGAIYVNADVASTPFCQITLDGDASWGFVDGTKSTYIGKKNGVPGLLDMNGHTLTRKGYGRTVFDSVVITNAGPIVLEDVDPASNGDWRNFVVFTLTGKIFPVDGDISRAPVTAGNGARLVVQDLETPIPVPMVVTGTNAQFAVFSQGHEAEDDYNAWGGPVTLSNEYSRLYFYAYGDGERNIRISGPISGPGSLCNARGGGSYYILAPTNTYTGETRFEFATGSGAFGSVTFATDHSIPDYSKAYFDYYGTVNVRVSEDRTTWPDASIGNLLREATFGNYNAMVGIDMKNSGDYTLDAASLGDVSASKGGIAPYGVGRTLTLTGALDMPLGTLGAYSGTLSISGEGVRNIKLLRASGQCKVSTGVVEVVNGADVRLSNSASIIASHDNTFSRLRVANAHIGLQDGLSDYPPLYIGCCTRASGIMELEDGAEVSTRYFVGFSSNGYGGAIYVKGGTLDSLDACIVGRECSGYLEVDGGTCKNVHDNYFYIGYRNEAPGLVHVKSGRFVYESPLKKAVLVGTQGFGHFRQSGGTCDIGAAMHLVYSASAYADTTGILTIDGEDALFLSTNITANSYIVMAGQTNANAILNLNAGVLSARNIFYSSQVYPGAACYVNFDGGTLRAPQDNPTWFRGMTRTTVYDGGAVIDTDGHSATLSASLTAPEGQGVTAVAWDPSVYDGFIGSPAVSIEGDGTGASAYAEFDSDTGRVTGIRVTSPGCGYTWAKARIWFGGRNGPAYQMAWTNDCTLGTCESGGLVKKGEGTLTLSGSNTYTGDTVVVEGTLCLGSSGALPSESTLVVKGGTVEAASGVTFPSSITLGLSADELDEERTYVLANFPDGIPSTRPEVVGADALPPGWELSYDNNQLRLYYARGTLIIFR